MKDFIKKEIAKVSYNKYSDYRIKVLMAYIISITYNLVNYVSIDNYNLNSALAIMGCGSVTELFIDRFQKDSKEIYELKTLYDEYVKSIASLNKEFNIDDDIVKMSELFFSLYYYGYLSVDKKYNFTANGVMDLSKVGLMGIELSRGIGVCRHISRLFLDVAKESGFDLDIVRTLTLDTDKESDNSIFLMKLQSLLECESCNINTNNISFETVKDRFIREYGNHELLGVNYGEEYLLLDPTNNEYCFPYKTIMNEDNGMIEKIKNITIKNKLKYPINEQTILVDTSFCFSVLRGIVTNTKTNKNEPYKKVKDKIDRLKETKLDLIMKRDSVLCLVGNNIGRIDEFYNSNKELYEEMNNSMKCLKRRVYEKD